MCIKMDGHALMDKIRKKEKGKGFKVADIKSKMRENHLHWFYHGQRRPEKASLMKVEGWKFELCIAWTGRDKQKMTLGIKECHEN